MPNIAAKLDNKPLFTDEDPLTVTIPGVGEFRLKNRKAPLPDEQETNPESKPLTWLVTYLASMAYEAPEDVATGKTPKGDELYGRITAAVDLNRSDSTKGITMDDLGIILGDIDDAYADAEKALIAREGGRPTKRRRR